MKTTAFSTASLSEATAGNSIAPFFCAILLKWGAKVNFFLGET
jgi:hypothetical protein